MQQICSDYYRLHPSIIDAIFTGLMKTVVTCRKCGHSSITFNPFMTQSLSVKSTLSRSLHDVFDPHQIDGQYLCEKCKKASKATVMH